MTPTPKRRWFAYSLRTLFVVVTVFAVTCGYLMHRGRARHEALQHLGRRGQYLFSYQSAWKSLPLNKTTSRWPRWLHTVIYTENLESVSDIDVGVHMRPKTPGTTMPQATTDDDLRSMTWFPEVEHLNVSSQHVTDDGITSLSGLTELRWLTLRVPKLTDRGLEHLRRLKKLDQLNLLGTQVSESGVRTLREALPRSVKVVVIEDDGSIP